MEILGPEETLTPEQEQALQQARALARLLDDQFQIAGFGVGLDGIIGLIPGVGDAFTTAMGLSLIHI